MTIWHAVFAAIDEKKGQVSFDLKSGEDFKGKFTVLRDGKIEPVPPKAGAREVLLRSAAARWEDLALEPHMEGKRDVLRRWAAALREMLPTQT